MTNEQKLIKLLQIAVENGWEDKKDLINNIDSIVDGIYIYVDDVDFVGTLHSLNDLVTNWEEGEISFIEALCEKNTIVTNTNTVIIDSEPEVNLYSTYFPVKDIAQYYQFEWVSLPTSQRIEYLFRIFKHLL